MARTVPEMASTEPYIWLLVGFAGIPTVVFWPWLGSRIGNDLALSLACGIEAVGVYLSAGLNSDVGIILGALILGGTFMGITALAFLEGQKRFPGILLVSTAILTSAFGLGQMLGPYTAGVLIDMTDSFNIVMSASASTLLLAAILVINPKRLGLNW